MTSTVDASAKDRSSTMLLMTSLLTRPPALRITGLLSAGPKNCSGTTRGSRQVTGREGGQRSIRSIKLCFQAPEKSENGQTMRPPPELNDTARSWSIVPGIFHVSANLRFFSRKPWILESVLAMVAVV